MNPVPKSDLHHSIAHGTQAPRLTGDRCNDPLGENHPWESHLYTIAKTWKQIRSTSRGLEPSGDGWDHLFPKVYENIADNNQDEFVEGHRHLVRKRNSGSYCDGLTQRRVAI